MAMSPLAGLRPRRGRSAVCCRLGARFACASFGAEHRGLWPRRAAEKEAPQLPVSAAARLLGSFVPLGPSQPPLAEARRSAASAARERRRRTGTPHKRPEFPI
eukprot:gnl/Chilomastix_cuspidata/6300.p11 GENE.gnl/Chilomastix_cuspidata/6300~~gnl/Chilomastix_cuspidata/6300.p11  ORF type:complete len:103 (-),score=21.58 gnl/Chilomastix_cuspidata/6300:992-1300(-)